MFCETRLYLSFQHHNPSTALFGSLGLRYEYIIHAFSALQVCVSVE